MGNILHIIEWKIFLIREPWSGDGAWGRKSHPRGWKTALSESKRLKERKGRVLGWQLNLFAIMGRHVSQPELSCLVGFWTEDGWGLWWNTWWDRAQGQPWNPALINPQQPAKSKLAGEEWREAFVKQIYRQSFGFSSLSVPMYLKKNQTINAIYIRQNKLSLHSTHICLEVSMRNWNFFQGGRAEIQKGREVRHTFFYFSISFIVI